MADAQEPTITATAPAAVAVVAPAASPAIAPENTHPASVAETPAASSEAAPSSTEPAKVETPTPPTSESILGDEPAKADDKKDTSADNKVADKTEGDPNAKASDKADTKATDGKEAPVELPKYEEFKIPENLSLGKEPLEAFSKILGEIEVGKLDHVGMQAAGQKLIDLATQATTDSIKRLNDYYVDFHENQKKEWFDSAKKDPDLGNGNEDAFREIAGNLRTAIDEFGGSETQRAEFRQLMKDTGVGNHPAQLRMLNNMHKKIDSYTKETNGRSVPAKAPAPSKVKDYQRFYTGVQG